jgi:HEPN domain-containing protein
MPDPDRVRKMAALWLSRARADLALARVVLEGRGELEPWLGVFHAQQAAEKAIKAVLIASNINPPYIHDLSELRKRVPADVAVGASVNEVERLDQLSAGVRYLGLSLGLMEQPEPGWEEAEASLRIAAAIVDAATAQIRGS